MTARLASGERRVDLGLWSDPGWAEIQAASDRIERSNKVRAARGIFVFWHERRAGEMNQIPLLVRETLTPREWGRRAAEGGGG